MNRCRAIGSKFRLHRWWLLLVQWSVALITVCKSERERQKRDTRGLDLDFRGLLPSAALSSSESLCSGRHGAKLMWWVGGGLGLFTPTYVHF